MLPLRATPMQKREDFAEGNFVQETEKRQRLHRGTGYPHTREGAKRERFQKRGAKSCADSKYLLI
jgi:hypothetical protein